MRRELRVSAAADGAPPFELRQGAIPQPGLQEVLVRVRAAAVNPIDAKRAEGYGRRLLGLKGAAHFPVVLGNDLAGEVLAVGGGVSDWQPGDRVYGLVDTGRAGGTHASHVCVPARLLLRAPATATDGALAVLPYAFTTMWRALRGAGLTPATAPGRHVLVNGASGGLGQLALRTLSDWGALATAVCGRGREGECLDQGAADALARGPGVIEALPARFDATLNFGHWDDEHALLARLAPAALGHASTVHPLLPNFDQLGWWQGAWANRRAWSAARRVARARHAQARYAWTLFRSDLDAMAALATAVQGGRLHLGPIVPYRLDDAADAFAHARRGQPGRAVLLPD